MIRTPAPPGGRFACDDYLDRGFRSYHRSVEVAAPPAVTFRWLCQLKTASYSYFDAGSETLTPGADELAVGQPFLVFEIVEFEPGRHITGRIPRSRRSGYGTITVTYRIDPTAAGSRIAVRINAATDTAVARLRATILAAGDAVMMRRQLARLKSLAERAAIPY
ncbi:MAG: SRPBCC family protein [Pseudonocardiaceae bacterium]